MTGQLVDITQAAKQSIHDTSTTQNNGMHPVMANIAKQPDDTTTGISKCFM